MSVPQSWRGIAFNQMPDSENEIHNNEVAKKMGYSGGLVPGVTISACIIQPAITAWGMDWLSRGCAHVKVSNPIYDGEHFDVELADASAREFSATLRNAKQQVIAEAEVSLTAELPAEPAMRGDRFAAGRVPNTCEGLQRLKEAGMGALPARWSADMQQAQYLADESQVPDLLKRDGGGYANMSFILGLTNFALAANVAMNPWVHIETTSQNFRPIPDNSGVLVESQIVDLFEKKGHQFVDVGMNIFLYETQQIATTVLLRAIYRMRGR